MTTVFHDTYPSDARLGVFTQVLIKATAMALNIMKPRPASAFLLRPALGIAHVQEHRDTADHREQLDRDSLPRGTSAPHRQRRDDGVHHQSNGPQTRRHRGEHREALDLLREQVVGQPPRGLGRARGRLRQRRLDARGDQSMFPVSHGLSTFRNRPEQPAWIRRPGLPARERCASARRCNVSRFSMIEWFERIKSARISSRGR